MTAATQAGNPKYPAGRPQFYAQKFTRLLGKLCVANEVGADGCFFLITIAALEDAKKYTGSVNFYNTQLMPIIGQTREETFRKLRSHLTESGWLHCEIPPAGTRQAAIYWTLIPPEYAGLDTGSFDEQAPEQDEYLRGYQAGLAAAKSNRTERKPRTKLCRIRLNTTQNRTLKRHEGVHRSDVEAYGEAASKRMVKRTTSLPTPNPLPSPIPNTNTAPSAQCVSDADEFRLESPKDKGTKAKNKGFSKPTVAEVAAYCRERLNGINAEEFIDYCNSVGWVIRAGKKPMKDWKSAVHTWEKNKASNSQGRSAYGKSRTIPAGPGINHDPNAKKKNPEHGVF